MQVERLDQMHLDLRGHPDYLKFKHATRVHFMLLLKIHNMQELNPELPACRPLTLVELHAFAKGGSDRIQITEHDYRFDFQLDFEHIFNLEAMRVFAVSFIQHVDLGRYDLSMLLQAGLLDIPRAEAAIRSHVKNVKRRFVGLYPAVALAPPAPDLSPRGMRKIGRYKARSAEVRAVCPEHSDLLSRTGASVVSSDESSDEGESLEIISPDWRSAALQAWMRFVETSLRRRQSSQSRRVRVPFVARSRIPSNKINVAAVAPSRLPYNCYNPRWLTTRSAEEIVSLDIENEAYDLTPLANL